MKPLGGGRGETKTIAELPARNDWAGAVTLDKIQRTPMKSPAASPRRKLSIDGTVPEWLRGQTQVLMVVVTA